MTKGVEARERAIDWCSRIASTVGLGETPSEDCSYLAIQRELGRGRQAELEAKIIVRPWSWIHGLTIFMIRVCLFSCLESLLHGGCYF